MFHQKIDISAASPHIVGETHPPLDTVARLWSVAIVAALPLIGVWLLLQWVWSDVKAVGHAVRRFHRDAAEEFSRLT